jgi:hypothetical protein
MLLQATVDGRGLVLKAQCIDGLEPRRQAPVPDITTRPLSEPAPQGALGAGRLTRPLSPAFIAGLRAALQQPEGPIAGIVEETGGAADVTGPTAMQASKKRYSTPSQVLFTSLPVKWLEACIIALPYEHLRPILSHSAPL